MPKANKDRYGKFEDARQAQQHLYQRYVVYNGKFVQIYQIADRLPVPDEPAACLASVYTEPYDPVKPRVLEHIPLNDEGFNDFKFDPLGWINHDTGAILMELLPIRQTKHGYGPENVEYYGFARNGNDAWLGRPEVQLPDLLFSEGAREMLRNEYPLYVETTPIILGNPGFSAAVSRRYAVQTDADGYSWLWRGASRVGLIVDKNTVRLGKRYQYLREELGESDIFAGVIVL